MSALQVRPAREDDVDAIGSIHVRGWRRAYAGLMPAAFLDSLSAEERAEAHRAHLRAPDPGTSRWVAQDEAGLAGFSVLGPAREGFGEPAWMEIYAIYVDPDRWRSGAGRALMHAAIEESRHGGAATACLWVLRDNAPARRFYEAMGWRADGAEKTFAIPGFEAAEVPEVRYRRDLT